MSQRKRKLIERVFGWSQAEYRRTAPGKAARTEKVDWFYRLTIAAYNLVRMRRLIPVQAMTRLGPTCLWRLRKRPPDAKNNRNPTITQAKRREKLQPDAIGLGNISFSAACLGP